MEYSVFWQSLLNHQYSIKDAAGGHRVFRFETDGGGRLPTPKRPLGMIFRNLFPSLLDALCQNGKRASQRTVLATSDVYNKSMLLLGTPGMGKSYFLFYILYAWSLPRDHPESFFSAFTTVVLQTPEDGTCFVFRKECKDVRKYEQGWEGKGLEQEAALYLVDEIEPAEWMSSSTVLLVSSPREEIWRRWSDKTGANRRYLQIWSPQELLLANAEFNHLTDSKVLSRFEDFGGSPRLVLKEKEEIDVTDAFMSCRPNLEQVMVDVATSSAVPKNSHILFHLVVDDEKYQHATIRFASHLAEEIIVDELICERKLTNLLSAHGGATRSCRGMLFEAYGLIAMRNGNWNYLAAQMPRVDGAESSWKMGALELVIFARLSHIEGKIRRDVFYFPEVRASSGIDGLVVCNVPNSKPTVLLLHYTIGHRPPISCEEIESVLLVLDPKRHLQEGVLKVERVSMRTKIEEAKVKLMDIRMRNCDVQARMEETLQEFDVAIVFVVPKDCFEEFSRRDPQRFSSDHLQRIPQWCMSLETNK